MDRWVSRKELEQYVYTQPDQPDVIPYITSYYRERVGFCMSQAQLDSLPDTLVQCDSLETVSIVENPMEDGVPRQLLDKKGLKIDQ